MPSTPDRHPGPLEEDEEIRLGGDAVGDPAAEGRMRYVGGAFRFFDSIGVYDPRTGSGGVAVQDEGTPLGVATTLNFTGGAVAATLAAGVATVKIPGMNRMLLEVSGSVVYTGDGDITLKLEE